MFIHPTPKGHHVLDAITTIPSAIVAAADFIPNEDEGEGEPETDSVDPFMESLEDESFYDDFLDNYLGMHIVDTTPKLE